MFQQHDLNYVHLTIDTLIDFSPHLHPNQNYNILPSWIFIVFFPLVFGCRTGAIGLSFAAFGQGTGAIYLDNVQCTGTELNIRNCSLLTTHNCVHAEDASVICIGIKSMDNDYLEIWS